MNFKYTCDRCKAQVEKYPRLRLILRKLDCEGELTDIEEQSDLCRSCLVALRRWVSRGPSEAILRGD